MSMKDIVRSILDHKERTIPILSFPCTQLMNISVKELISSAENQARGMETIVSRYPVGAALNMMDLSVEAQALGCEIHFSDDEIPTVSGCAISSIDMADDIKIPPIGTARTGIYIEGVRLAKQRIKSVPVFCGVIGPYSLAGRVYNMTELMMDCFDYPDKVNVLLEKCTEFLIAYINAFKAAGADGVILAEPAAGLLSPDMCEAFSSKFVRRIIEETGSEDFVFCYHNCGGGVIDMSESIASLGADIYHFGNAIELDKIIPLMPQSSIVMGNLNPVLFGSGTADEIRAKTRGIFEKCSKYDNFMLSSGCDIPANAKWENIEAYFMQVAELYK